MKIARSLSLMYVDMSVRAHVHFVFFTEERVSSLVVTTHINKRVFICAYKHVYRICVITPRAVSVKDSSIRPHILIALGQSAHEFQLLI